MFVSILTFVCIGPWFTSSTCGVFVSSNIISCAGPDYEFIFATTTSPVLVNKNSQTDQNRDLNLSPFEVFFGHDSNQKLSVEHILQEFIQSYLKGPSQQEVFTISTINKFLSMCDQRWSGLARVPRVSLKHNIRSGAGQLKCH